MIKELDNSANMMIASLNDSVIEAADLIRRVDGALNAIYEVQRRVNKMQVKTVTGSKQWHRFETLDDLLHEALVSLGD